MNGTLRVALLAVLLFAAGSSPAWAGGWHGHGHGRGWHRGWHGHGWQGHGWHHGGHGSAFFIDIGPGFWWGPPWWCAAPPYYAYPGPVIVREPPVYIEREPAPETPQAYWYFCESAGDYYPSVPTCPEPWVKVPPRPE